MAAILPHLAERGETSPIERQYYQCVTSLAGQSLGQDAPHCPAPNEVLAQAHAGLLTMTYVRSAVEASLAGRAFRVQNGDASGLRTRDVFLILDGPIGSQPAWNPPSNPAVRQFKLLSWTSKMSCPSWSLPAGVPESGGTCPGAAGGQSIVATERLIAAQDLVTRVTGKPVNLAQCVCEFCYAEGGQYSTGSVQYAQVLRHLWARQAIEMPACAPDGSPSTMFIETMVAAIQGANFRLAGGISTTEEITDGATATTRRETTSLPPEPSGRRFFRVHDSGDFFSAEYLRQWKAVADRLTEIMFWAPTRIWATSWGITAVNEINGAAPSNLIIRPSAFEVNEPTPGPRELGPGWAAGTTVIAAGQDLGMTPDRARYVAAIERRPVASGSDPRYDWSCRAYATDDQKHTCRRAVAPPGMGGPHGTGCRACWVAPGEIINYALH